jgi:signal transduction protein with GAF and PtsI domain
MSQKQPARRIYLHEYKAISRAISTYEDFNLLANHFVEGICTSFHMKGCSIMLYDDREKQLFRVASFGLSRQYLSKGPIVIEDKHSSFFTGKPVFVQDFKTDPRVQYPEHAVQEGLVSMLSVPIKIRSETIGVVRIYNNEPWTLHEDDIDSFSSLAEHLGLLVENNGLKNFLDRIKIAMASLPRRMLEEFDT